MLFGKALSSLRDAALTALSAISQEIPMRGSKQPKNASPDKLAKPTAGIELSESALAQTSGGALNAYLKLDTIKCDGSVRTDVATPLPLLPGAKPGN
jgi:hypothetical protein